MILVPTGEGNASIDEALGDLNEDGIFQCVANSIAHHRRNKRFSVADGLRDFAKRNGMDVSYGKDGGVVLEQLLALKRYRSELT